jgi:hypothetical protein
MISIQCSMSPNPIRSNAFFIAGSNPGSIFTRP